MTEETTILICDGCNEELDTHGDDERWLRHVAQNYGWITAPSVDPDEADPLDICPRCKELRCEGCGHMGRLPLDRAAHERSCVRLRDRIVLEKLVAQAVDDGREDDADELRHSLTRKIA